MGSLTASHLSVLIKSVKRLCIITIFILTLPSVLFAATDNAEWIEKMKNLNANSLHASLPKMSYEKWFASFIGNNIKLNWEVNDCGEQDGNGIQEDFPVCVEASAYLSKHKKLAISSVLGTYKKGIVGSPKIWMIYLYENEQYKIFRNLEDLTRHLEGENTSKYVN